MTITFQQYAQYAFVVLICLMCVYNIIAASSLKKKTELSSKEKFYNICKLTNYHTYQEVLLFCSETTNTALTTSHLVAYAKQGPSTYVSKVISLHFIKHITCKVVANTADSEQEMSNIIVTERDGNVHILPLPSKESTAFMKAWNTRPASSMAYVV